MQGTIVNQGVELMLFGMGTVLVFLSVLVISMGRREEFAVIRVALKSRS